MLWFGDRATPEVGRGYLPADSRREMSYDHETDPGFVR